MVGPDAAESIKIITRAASERIARYAFEYAVANGRHKVTAVHKANIMKLSDGLFLDCFRRVAADYPEIAADDRIVDTACMRLVMSPETFDVLLLENLYGDIVSDLAAGLVGGLGLAPGLCVGEHQAMAQATHGSAPDIAGRNIANPYAMIMSGQMLLAWLGRRHKEASAAARGIEAAVARVIAAGKHLTRDLGGEASTTQMGDAIAAAVKESGPDHCGEQRQ
jgi:isocitrate/isopropylmalate dehydrogenase